MPKMGRKRAGRPRATPLYAWWESTAPDVKNRPTPESLAKRFGCSRSTVYGLLDGTRRPSLDLAAMIEARTGIPASAWKIGRRAA